MHRKAKRHKWKANDYIEDEEERGGKSRMQARMQEGKGERHGVLDRVTISKTMLLLIRQLRRETLSFSFLTARA